jgi:prepilin-type N-terminal cleavage/methylation domain-containing protein
MKSPSHRHRTSGRGSARPGFTLLEVLLASAIGLLILGGVYQALDKQLRHA